MKTAMNHADFARQLGFPSWDDLMAASQDFGPHGIDWSYYVTETPDRRFAAWDDVELSADRVTYHATWNEAAEAVIDGALADYAHHYADDYDDFDDLCCVDRCCCDDGRITGFRLSLDGDGFSRGCDERFGAWRE